LLILVVDLVLYGGHGFKSQMLRGYLHRISIDVKLGAAVAMHEY
jgi:hypothetical protein